MFNGGCVCHSLEHRVAGPVSAVRPDVYRGALSARLCRMLFGGGVVTVASLVACGCSTNVKLGGMFAKEEPEYTGSILSPPSPEGTGLPPASDLAYAKLAAAEVVGHDSEDA